MKCIIRLPLAALGLIVSMAEGHRGHGPMRTAAGRLECPCGALSYQVAVPAAREAA